MTLRFSVPLEIENTKVVQQRWSSYKFLVFFFFQFLREEGVMGKKRSDDIRMIFDTHIDSLRSNSTIFQQ